MQIKKLHALKGELMRSDENSSQLSEEDRMLEHELKTTTHVMDQAKIAHAIASKAQRDAQAVFDEAKKASVSAAMQFPNAKRLVLIFFASASVAPVAPERPTSSDPARSTIESRPLVTWCAVDADSMIDEISFTEWRRHALRSSGPPSEALPSSLAERPRPSVPSTSSREGPRWSSPCSSMVAGEPRFVAGSTSGVPARRGMFMSGRPWVPSGVTRDGGGGERANRAELRRRIARRVPSRRRRCVGLVDQRRALCTIVAGDGVAILCLITVSEQTACDRDDVAFILVAANARRFDAAFAASLACSSCS